MARFQVVGTLRVNFDNDVEADTLEEAVKLVEDMHPVHELNWQSEDIDVEDVVEVDN